MLDLQQQHTTLITGAQVAQKVRATVISYYPRRGSSGEDEALVDAGAIAFSKDTGPSGGYGEVVGKPWRLARISQEHGILAQTDNGEGTREKLEIGAVVEIIGQHACLIAAVRPFHFK
jgi:D-serine deaminase-like pyridoxal phosphate-dependent protein